MSADPRTVRAHARLLFMAKNIERIGDICANIGKGIHCRASGKG